MKLHVTDSQQSNNRSDRTSWKLTAGSYYGLHSNCIVRGKASIIGVLAAGKYILACHQVSMRLSIE